MAILAGIDEAGFGPVLGPLVVSSVVFRVPDDRLDICLWDALGETCARKPSRGARPLVVADSKQLYRSRSGLAGLERAALVMLAVAGRNPRTWKGLVETLSEAAVGCLAEYPWYADSDFELPAAEGVGDLATRANAVRRNCAQAGVSFLGATSELLPEGHYNRLVHKTRNKAIALLGLVLRLTDRILAGSPGETVHLFVDRLGGRSHYRAHLMTAMPTWELAILEESADRSAYRLTTSAQAVVIEFITGGDRKHFPVALASIYSKYLRELAMRSFNDYWSRQADGLRPTAGYYTDAQRWLKDVAPVIDRLAIDRSLLVRQR